MSERGYCWHVWRWQDEALLSPQIGRNGVVRIAMERQPGLTPLKLVFYSKIAPWLENLQQ
jgi:hypothetical protein